MKLCERILAHLHFHLRLYRKIRNEDALIVFAGEEVIIDVGNDFAGAELVTGSCSAGASGHSHVLVTSTVGVLLELTSPGCEP
jgi:hypothetical protein